MCGCVWLAISNVAIVLVGANITMSILCFLCRSETVILEMDSNELRMPITYYCILPCT